MKQKKIQDYYEQLYELYPTISKSDIRKIMQFGLKSFTIHNNYGADVLLQNPNMWLYCGRMMKDSIKYFEYYKRKMIIKIKIKHKRLKIPWDGYYYFALFNKGYEDYKSQKKTKGRPKKFFNYGNVILYKFYDECNLKNSGAVSIFRITFNCDLGSKLYKPNFRTDKAELILERNPLTFKDILASNYKYQYITDYTKYKKTNKNKIHGKSKKSCEKHLG